jgi:hypothetical protein
VIKGAVQVHPVVLFGTVAILACHLVPECKKALEQIGKAAWDALNVIFNGKNLEDGTNSEGDKGSKTTDQPAQPNENNLDKLPEKKGNKASQDAGYIDAHDAKDGQAIVKSIYITTRQRGKNGYGTVRRAPKRKYYE